MREVAAPSLKTTRGCAKAASPPARSSASGPAASSISTGCALIGAMIPENSAPPFTAGRVSTSIALSATRIAALPSPFQSASGVSPASASAAPFATPTPRPPSSAGCAKADRASHSRNLPAAGASGTRWARSPSPMSSEISAPFQSKAATPTREAQSPRPISHSSCACGASGPERAARNNVPAIEPAAIFSCVASVTRAASGVATLATQTPATPSTGSRATSPSLRARRSTARAASEIGASSPPIVQTTARSSPSPAAGHAATGARPRSTPIARHWPPASRRSIEMATSPSERAAISARLPAGAGARERTCAPAPFSVFSPESVSAPSFFSMGSARRSSTPLRGASSLSATSPSLEAFFGLLARRFFSLHRGARLQRQAVRVRAGNFRRAAVATDATFQSSARGCRRSITSPLPSFSTPIVSMSPKLERSTTLSFASEKSTRVGGSTTARGASGCNSFESSEIS